MGEQSAALRVLPSSADQVDLLNLLIEPSEFAAIPSQASRYSRCMIEDGVLADVPTFEKFTAEIIVNFEASLVIASPFTSSDTVAQLDRYGMPHLSLPARKNWQDIRRTIELLGKELDRASRAQRAIKFLEGELATIKKDALAITGGSRKRVLWYVNYGSGGFSAGPGLSIHWVIETSGLKNVAANLQKDGAFAMSLEQLISLDPDYLVMASGDTELSQTEEFLLSRPELQNLDVVKKKRFLKIPSYLSAASSHEMIRAAKELQAAWTVAEARR